MENHRFQLKNLPFPLNDVHLHVKTHQHILNVLRMGLLNVAYTLLTAVQ